MTVINQAKQETAPRPQTPVQKQKRVNVCQIKTSKAEKSTDIISALVLALLYFIILRPRPDLCQN